MKTMVTGSEGFIGKHLCAMLREDGHEVIGFDLKSGEDVVTCILPFYDDVDRVFHLAAQTDARCNDTALDARNNIISAIRVMNQFKTKVVFSSSSAVNFPTSPYGISKLTCEHYAKLFGCGVVRFCNIYGPGSKSFMDIYRDCESVKANLPGNQVRTYAHVDAACEALLTCKPGQFNILSGEDLTVQQIVDTVYHDKKVSWYAPKQFDLIEGRQVYGL